MMAQRHETAEGNLPEGLVIVPQKLPPPLFRKGNFSKDNKVSELLKEDGLDESNRQGFEAELRVGRLIGRLPYVASVRQREPNSPEDKDMGDLMVGMIESFAIPFVKVQVKRKQDTGHRLSRQVSKRAAVDDPGLREEKSEEERRRRKKKWLMSNRIVIIYNSRVRDESVIPVTSGEIVASFFGQVAAIVSFERSQAPGYNH